MFKVGDAVRLNHGWTRMVVIDVQGDEVTVKYDSEAYSVENRVTDWDFKNPQLTTNKYTRQQSGFTAWDGASPTKVYYTMPTAASWKVISGPYRGQVGTFLNTTSNGSFALEMEDHSILSFNPVNLEENVPATFLAKTVGSRYRCHYEVPAGANIRVGQVLVSKTGNVYVVIKTDTKERNPKSVFKGHRLVTADL